MPLPRITGHNDEVAGRIGRLVAFFRRAEPRGAAPTGWALALDAAVAVGAAIGAVYEMAQRSQARAVHRAVPWSAPGRRPARHPGRPAAEQARPAAAHRSVPAHASLLMLAAAALTALPLAARRLYPIRRLAGHHRRDRGRAPDLRAAGRARYRRLRRLQRDHAQPVPEPGDRRGGRGHRRRRRGRSATSCPRFPGRLTAIFAILPAAAAGLGIRVLRRRLADSTARLRRAADEAAAATERALAAERARIAAELHDVVTHNVSVMIVQAGAARKIMASSPADAEDALLAVEATGREAMTELRNLLGLLSPAADGRDSRGRRRSAARCADGPPRRAAPAAGARRARRADRPGVGRRAPGRAARSAAQPRPLPPGADLAAYRVVQEGLTNVLRHAGPAAATRRRGLGRAACEITVSDDGPRQRAGRRATAARRRPGAGCSGCASGSRCTAASSPRGRGRAAAGRSGRPADSGPRRDRRRRCRSFGTAVPASRRPLTVVIADDQALVRGGFRLILKAAGIDVVAEAADGAQAVAAVLAHRPDVVLMDVRMPVMDGIEATRRIRGAPGAAADADHHLDHVRPGRVRLRGACPPGRAASCSRT